MKSQNKMLEQILAAIEGMNKKSTVLNPKDLTKTSKSLGTNVTPTGNNEIGNYFTSLNFIPVVGRLLSGLFTHFRKLNILFQVIFFIKNIRSYFTIYKFSKYMFRLFTVVNVIVGLYTILSEMVFIDSITMIHLNIINFGTAYIEHLANIYNLITSFIQSIFDKLFNRIRKEAVEVVFERDPDNIKNPFEFKTNAKLDPNTGFYEISGPESNSEPKSSILDDRAIKWLAITFVCLIGVGLITLYWDDISKLFPKSGGNSGGSSTPSTPSTPASIKLTGPNSDVYGVASSSKGKAPMLKPLVESPLFPAPESPISPLTSGTATPTQQVQVQLQAATPQGATPQVQSPQVQSPLATPQVQPQPLVIPNDDGGPVLRLSAARAFNTMDPFLTSSSRAAPTGLINLPGDYSPNTTNAPSTPTIPTSSSGQVN